MSSETILAVASQVPTTVQELHSISGLSENLIKEYGERLVKNINAFIAQEGLQKYLDKLPAKRPRSDAPTGKKAGPASKKRAAVPKGTDVINIDDDEDEFDVGIDFSAIDVPSSKDASSSKSPYF